ncbi:unnamed protein product [Alternaria alternata]
MDHQRMSDWQMQPWNEDTIDPSWFSNFLATDPGQDAPNAASGAPAAFSVDDDLAIDPNFHDFTFENISQPMSTVTSPSHPFDAFQLNETHGRPLVQRQHTLPRRRSKYFKRRSTGTASPIAIPGGSPRHEEGQSLAIQRWRNSPPEDEAASLSAIYHALEDRPVGASPRISRPSSSDAFRKYRGPSSTTSLDSAASESSLRSVNSSHSATSQSKRRSQATKTRKGRVRGTKMNDPERIFKCTFCCDTFKHKYDWTRHEKSLHLNLESWMYPTPQHLQQHNHAACTDGNNTPRVFHRKDHLTQHLRLVHGVETLPLIDDWKLETLPVKSRCGICDANLNSWDERSDHLAAHFREGKTMADWKGEHCFEPDVAARVINAFPPYLLAEQANTVVPFSATNPGSIDHTKQLISRIQLEEPAQEPPAAETTHTPDQQAFEDSLTALRELSTQHDHDFATVLTRHLSRFARQQMLSGIIPTDEMFQRESRRLLYQDPDDGWNQTVADNANWLQDFRRRSGLEGSPNT